MMESTVTKDLEAYTATSRADLHITVEALAPAFFGLLATRVSDTIVEDGSRVAAALGIKTPARCISTMITLLNGPKGVSEIGRELGVTHVAVMKNVQRLTELGYIEVLRDPNDLRRKPLALTHEGREAAHGLVEFIQDLRKVYLEVFSEIGVDAYAAVSSLEVALKRRSFFDRLSSEVLSEPD